MFDWSWLLRASLFCVHCMYGSSNCLGGFSKSYHRDNPVKLHKQSNESSRGSRGHATPPSMWWTSSSNEMDNNGNNSRQQRNPGSISGNNHTQETRAPVNSNANSPVFVNHALILWTERRNEWVGSRQRPRPQQPREPVY